MKTSLGQSRPRINNSEVEARLDGAQTAVLNLSQETGWRTSVGRGAWAELELPANSRSKSIVLDALNKLQLFNEGGVTLFDQKNNPVEVEYTSNGYRDLTEKVIDKAAVVSVSGRSLNKLLDAFEEARVVPKVFEAFLEPAINTNRSTANRSTIISSRANFAGSARK